MKLQKKALLIEGPVAPTLAKLTLPMIVGIVAMMAFNLADTYFVGQLGTKELAAMSFTFPVVMIISSLALGLGMGTSAVVARAIGKGDHGEVQRLTTDALLLSLSVVAVAVVAGILTINPLFRLLGATEDILPLIRQYMIIWYPGVMAVIIPMVGNNAIRATGDTKTPSAVMLAAVAVNILLDPVLIFGLGPFPRLELTGAAIATVFARAMAFAVSFWVLYKRDAMITFAPPMLSEVVDSWKRILFIGVPAAGTNMVVPVSAGIITRLVANYGPEAVAGFGVATRVEMFSLTVVMALNSVISPFVGQNWGAKKYDRVRSGMRYGQQFALGWGAAMFVLLLLFGKTVASLFNADPAVIGAAAGYLAIVPIAYGCRGVQQISTTALNVLNKPLQASSITITQAFVIYIPCAYLGSALFGLRGIFGAAALSYLLAGGLAYAWLKKTLREA